jgi:hypothetical protein
MHAAVGGSGFPGGDIAGLSVPSPSSESPVPSQRDYYPPRTEDSDQLGTSHGPSDTTTAGPPAQAYQANHEAPETRLRSNDPIATELSVDEHGKICYYGPTSAVHDPQVDTRGSQTPTACGTPPTRATARNFLTAYGKESATWEEFALGNASLETGIPRHIMAKLLHLYWTWVSPMFMWVYRPAFVRKCGSIWL